MSYVYLPNQNLSGNILMFDLQTWHIPNRVDGVKPRPVMDVTVQKLKNPTQQLAQVKKKRKALRRLKILISLRSPEQKCRKTRR